MKISIIRGEKWTNPLTYVRKNLKRGCQHPSHKLEILWQVAKNSFSRLLSYFVAQYNCGVVRKYILVFEKWVFSFDRSNMQIFTLNITRVVWPHLTNLLDLRYLCRHNPLFYHLNLIPCHWSWQRNIYFLVNIFVRHTFSMSKNSIKTKTVWQWQIWQHLLTFELLKDKRMVIKLL